MRKSQLDSADSNPSAFDFEASFPRSAELRIGDENRAHIRRVPPGSVDTRGAGRNHDFQQRFRERYGPTAVETFKQLVEDPEHSLAFAGRYFGFSREYSSKVFQWIYGHPYSRIQEHKRLTRETIRRVRKRSKSDHVRGISDTIRKMESIGPVSAIPRTGVSSSFFLNGQKVIVRVASKPILINRRRYFRFGNSNGRSGEADFNICLCKTAHGDVHFIIPSSAMPRCTVSIQPEAGPTRSKYARFLEAWHLLSNRADTRPHHS